jgi:hypothetical protein
VELCLTGAHIAITGLAADVAGAVALGLAFATKRPEAIRSEVPRAVGGTGMFDPDVISVGFPQELAYSLIRQRAEARLGLALLVGGFLQAASASNQTTMASMSPTHRWPAFVNDPRLKNGPAPRTLLQAVRPLRQRVRSRGG